ncbi:EboA domain-containing protein [Tellurirhabdus bombi]|uniref:EboA domain-containing protein n=1 Tax=Tellurirhabdus bombi TaxID=2907205 RepID=UPI001F283EC1|nr:EboA domain-containing protein [Tellurirhabdus bombi]
MNANTIQEALLDIIHQQPGSEKAVNYLTQQGAAYQAQPVKAVFYRVFAAIPRFTGKNQIEVTPEVTEKLDTLRPNFSIEGWTMDRLARVWWLLQLFEDDQETLVSTVETLIKSAEMNELAAIYSAFPVLPFPEAWRFQTTEAVRSNIGLVQEAIMIQNPYPAEYLDELAWNQLVMKAFFTEKDVTQILGLQERRNERLAAIVIDYARERRAAGRDIHSQLWTLAEPFISPDQRPEMEALFGVNLA